MDPEAGMSPGCELAAVGANKFYTQQKAQETAVEAIAEGIVADHPDFTVEDLVSSNRVTRNEDGHAKSWNLGFLGLGRLPESICALRLEGDLILTGNMLKALPKGFAAVTVGGDLKLDRNRLEHLPSGFENIRVGHDLDIRSNALEEAPESFPNVGGRISGNVIRNTQRRDRRMTSAPDLSGGVRLGPRQTDWRGGGRPDRRRATVNGLQTAGDWRGTKAEAQQQVAANKQQLAANSEGRGWGCMVM